MAAAALNRSSKNSVKMLSDLILNLVREKKEVSTPSAKPLKRELSNECLYKVSGRIGPIHFIGIGGIGMSGIAEILINQGYSVQGSDLKETEITLRLERMGASIKIGHDKNNLKNAAVVVISSAIDKKNPELNYARSAGLPVVRRAEMLQS